MPRLQRSNLDHRRSFSSLLTSRTEQTCVCRLSGRTFIVLAVAPAQRPLQEFPHSDCKTFVAREYITHCWPDLYLYIWFI